MKGPRPGPLVDGGQRGLRLASAVASEGEGALGVEVLDLVAKVADDVLQSHDDLVPVRELFLQPRDVMVAFELGRERSGDGHY